MAHSFSHPFDCLSLSLSLYLGLPAYRLIVDPRTLADLVLIASVGLLTLSALLGPCLLWLLLFGGYFGCIVESYGTLVAVSASI